MPQELDKCLITAVSPLQPACEHPVVMVRLSVRPPANVNNVLSYGSVSNNNHTAVNVMVNPVALFATASTVYAAL